MHFKVLRSMREVTFFIFNVFLPFKYHTSLQPLGIGVKSRFSQPRFVLESEGVIDPEYVFVMF